MAMENIENTDPRVKGDKALKGLNYKPLGLFGTDFSSSVAKQRETSVYGNPTNVGVLAPEDLGDSTYDENAHTLGDLNNLQDVRALNQGALTKLGAGVAKAVTTASTTFLDGTVGLIYGSVAAIKSAVTEDKPWQEDLAKLWDNSISNGLQAFNDKMEEALPNYRTLEEDSRAWYENMGTANFWADFLKQIGFTVGAFYSGGTWNKALKAAHILSSAGAAGLTGAFISAVNEGRIEANNNSRDWYKLESSKLDDAYAKRMEELNVNPKLLEGDNLELVFEPLVQQIASQPDVLQRAGDSNSSVNTKYKDLEALQNRYNELKELRDNYSKAQDDLNLRKAQMGLVDLAINVPLLTATNMFQFGNSFRRGFSSSKTASGGGRGFFGRLKDGVSNAIKGDAETPIRNVVRNVETGLYDYNKITTKKALLNGGKHFLSEGQEEMNQMWASELAGTAYQYDSPDAYYKSLIDSKANNETNGFIKGITEGFMNSWGDINKYQDFVMGGLTGLLGTPTFGRSNNSGHDTYLGRGKHVGLTGGIFGELTQASYDNAKSAEAVSQMNDYITNHSSDANFQARRRHHVRSNYFTDLMNGAAADGDSFEWHNNQDNVEFSAIDAFAQTGHLNDYKQMVDKDFDNMSDEDLEFIAQSTINTETGKALYTESDGLTAISVNSSEEDKQAMRDELNKKKEAMLKSIDQYEQSLGDMRTYTAIQDRDDVVRELAWLDWKLKKFKDRRADIINDNTGNMDNILSALNAQTEQLQQSLNQMASDTEGQVHNADLINLYQALIDENNAVASVFNDWKQGKFVALTDHGKGILLDDAFYEDNIKPTGMTAREFNQFASEMMDVSRLTSLHNQFNDKLNYYLHGENSAQEGGNNNSSSNTAHNNSSNNSNTTNNTNSGNNTTNNNPTNTGNQADVNQPTQEETNDSENEEVAFIAREEEEGGTEAPTNNPVNNPSAPVNPVNPVVQRVDDNHQQLEEEQQQANIINNSNALRLNIEGITKASQVQQLFNDLSVNDDDVKAIINDLETSNPNHPAVQAYHVNQFLDNVYNSILNADDKVKEDLASMWPVIKQAADNAKSVEDLLNSPAFKGEAINSAINGEFQPEDSSKFKSQEAYENYLRTSQASRDKQNAYYEQAMSDLLHKALDDYNTSSRVSNNPLPESKPIETTGADDNTSNETAEEPSTPTNNTAKPSTNKPCNQFVLDCRNTGMQDNQIRLAATQAGYSLEDIDLAMKDTAPVSQEEEERRAAIVPNYPEDQSNTFTEESKVSSQSAPTEDVSKANGYLRPNTTEVPIQNPNMPFDLWLQTYNAPKGLKDELRVRHKYLLEGGAFDRCNNGEVKVGQTVKFKVIKSANSEAGRFIVFLANDKGELIGDMPTNVGNYNGLRELIDDIRNKFEAEGSPDEYIYPITSTVNQIMVGKPQFEMSQHSLGEINPSLNIGIYTGRSIQTSVKDDRNPVVKPDEIQLPLNPKNGLVYVLVPNGRKGENRGYTAVLCTTPKFNQGTKDTIIGKKVTDALNKMAQAKTFSDLLRAFTELLEYLWIPDLMVNAFNGRQVLKSGDTAPITQIVIKRRADIENPNSALEDVIKINPKDPHAADRLLQALGNTQFNINLKLINTTEGRDMYNQIVRTNLKEGTETTKNNWFTFNPIINGKEQKATTIPTTGVNPNVGRSTNQHFTINGHDLELDSKNYKVWVDGKEQTPLPTTDPRHVTTMTNSYLAWAFVNNNPTATRVGDAVQTPYGWYDTKQGKLVLSPNNGEYKTANGVTIPTTKGTKVRIGDKVLTVQGEGMVASTNRPALYFKETGDNNSYGFYPELIATWLNVEVVNEETSTQPIVTLTRENTQAKSIVSMPSKVEDRISIHGSTGLTNSNIGPGDTHHFGNNKMNPYDARTVGRKIVTYNNPVAFGDASTVYVYESSTPNNIFHGSGRTDIESIKFYRPLTSEEQAKVIDILKQARETSALNTWQKLVELLDKVITQTPSNQNINIATKEHKYIGVGGEFTAIVEATPVSFSELKPGDEFFGPGNDRFTFEVNGGNGYYVVSGENGRFAVSASNGSNWYRWFAENPNPKVYRVAKQQNPTQTPSRQQTEIKAQQSTTEIKQEQTNPDVLGQAMINGKMENILKSELEDAIMYGITDDSCFDLSLDEQAKIIEDFRGNYRETNTNVSTKVFNKEEELKWLDRVLPNLTRNDRVRLVEGLIDNRAWGKFMNGIMLLSDQAAEGTTYHEAFHAVSQTLLTDRERDKMYKTAKEVYGDKSIYELEEDLAEDFRKKVQANTQPDSRLKRFFNKLWLNIKSIFSNRAKLEKLFYDINQGMYADRVLKIKEGKQYMQATVNQEELDNIKKQAIADSTFMKAPNGRPTNLTERQWLQVRTKAFKNWFGDWEGDPLNASKVVDENGEPLVVIHNTKTPNIKIFKPGIADSIYFADKGGQNFVSGFERGDYNYECFLNIRKPTFDTEWTGEEDSDGLLVRLSKQQIIDNTDSEEERNKAKEVLKDGEYAGFFAVSNSNQIKSAIENVGSFSTENDNIFYRTTDEIEAEANDLKSKWQAVKDANLAYPTREQAEAKITQEGWSEVAYVHERQGVFHVNPIAEFRSNYASLDSLLNVLRKEWMVENDRMKNQSLSYDRLSNEEVLMLADRGIDESTWNDMSLAEKERAKECAGV